MAVIRPIKSEFEHLKVTVKSTTEYTDKDGIIHGYHINKGGGFLKSRAAALKRGKEMILSNSLFCS